MGQEQRFGDGPAYQVLGPADGILHYAPPQNVGSSEWDCTKVLWAVYTPSNPDIVIVRGQQLDSPSELRFDEGPSRRQNCGSRRFLAARPRAGPGSRCLHGSVHRSDTPVRSMAPPSAAWSSLGHCQQAERDGAIVRVPSQQCKTRCSSIHKCRRLCAASMRVWNHVATSDHAASGISLYLPTRKAALRSP